MTDTVESAINASALRGIELSEHLAETLTDLEFEFLIRKRLELEFLMLPDLSEFSSYYKTVVLVYKHEGSDPLTWSVTLGVNFDKHVTSKGEVLHRSMQDAWAAHNFQSNNKISLLLSAPTLAAPVDPVSTMPAESDNENVEDTIPF